MPKVEAEAKVQAKKSFLPVPVKPAAEAPTMPKVEAEAKVEQNPIVRPEPEPESSPKVEVKPKSILKPTRKINAEFYIQHCLEDAPDKGFLVPASDSIVNSTARRFPLSEWNIDTLPINMPDRYKKLAFKSKQTEGPTKVVSLHHLLFNILCFPRSFLLTFVTQIFPEDPVRDSWTASGRAVIRNYAVVRYRLKSKA